MGALRFVLMAAFAVGAVYVLWRIVAKYFLDQTEADAQIDERLIEKVEEAELLEKQKILKDLDKGIERKKRKYQLDESKEE
jgi:hypothetical protein